MSMQTQIQKTLSKVDFLTSTMYEKNDLTNMVRPGDRFVVRQGDLIVTNYVVDSCRKRGLSKAYLTEEDHVYVFRRTHYIIPLEDKTVLVHNEHGVTVIPRPFHSLRFYTFNEAGD